ETVYSLNHKRLASLAKPATVLTSKSDLQTLESRLDGDIRRLTGSVLKPGSTHPEVNVESERRPDSRLQAVTMRSDGDTTVSGVVAMQGGTLMRPAVLFLGPVEESRAVLEDLAKDHVVMALNPRPTPVGTESIKSPYLGVFNLLSLRA